MRGISFIEEGQTIFIWPAENLFEEVLQEFKDKNYSIVQSEEVERLLKQSEEGEKHG